MVKGEQPFFTADVVTCHSEKKGVTNNINRGTVQVSVSQHEQQQGPETGS